mgnify:CR=1 FL=1
MRMSPTDRPSQAPPPSPPRLPLLRGSGPKLGRRLWPYALAAALLVTGCPRRFDPRAEEIHSQNPEAEADYRKAQALLQRGDLVGADQALQQFLSKYGPPPSDPLVPVAALQAAQVARSLGQPGRAKELAAPLAHPPPGTAAPSPWISDRARLELGLAQHRLGDFAEARALLAPLSAQIVDSEEATELHATLADLWLREDQPAEALREFDLFFHGIGVRSVELAYIRDQVAPLIARLPVDQQGKLRQRFGIEAPAPGAPAGDPAAARLAAAPVVGLVVPLGGKDRPLGERVLRGALWAAESLGGARPPSPLSGVDLRVRDTTGGDAASLIADLRRDGVQVLIGSPSRGAETAQLLAAAEREGLVTIDLSSRPTAAGAASPAPSPSPSRSTFHLLRSNTARAQALAQNFLASGLPTLAILAPATPYGQAMTRAFVDAVQERNRGGGVQIVAQLTFAEGATTFTAQAKRLLETAPTALYIPASATQLELIAAQLASSGVLPIYKVTRGTVDKPGLGNPPVKLLLASAEGMGERLLKNAGRYLQGAVLAPLTVGKLAIADSANSASRWDGFPEQVGAEPGALDGLGFDAVLAVRTACTRLRAQAPGARCSGEALAGALRGLNVEGATGAISFDSSGERSGQALLVRIDSSTLRAAR